MKKHRPVEFNGETLPEFETLAKEIAELESLKETPKDEKEDNVAAMLDGFAAYKANEAKEEEVKEPERVFMAKVVNVDKLRIRESPNETSSVVGFLNRGDIVKINGEAIDEIFFPIVTASGAEGFCMSQFLLIYEEGSYKEV